MGEANRLAELVGVHPVPRGSVIVIRGADDVGDWMDSEQVAYIAERLGHDKFLVVAVANDADLEVKDIEQLLQELEETLRLKRG